MWLLLAMKRGKWILDFPISLGVGEVQAQLGRNFKVKRVPSGSSGLILHASEHTAHWSRAPNRWTTTLKPPLLRWTSKQNEEGSSLPTPVKAGRGSRVTSTGRFGAKAKGRVLSFWKSIWDGWWTMLWELVLMPNTVRGVYIYYLI